MKLERTELKAPEQVNFDRELFFGGMDHIVSHLKDNVKEDRCLGR